MKRIYIAVLAGVFMVAGSAQAADGTGFYAGGGIGWNQLETDKDLNFLTGTATNQACIDGSISGYPTDNLPCYTYFDDGSSFNETAFGVDGFVGYQFTPALSAELQYVWFGEANRFDNVIGPNPQGGVIPTIPPLYQIDEELNYEQEASIRAVNIAGRYSWMFSKKWGINLVGGWTFAKAEYSQFADNLQVQAAGAPWVRPATKITDTNSDNGFIVGLGTTINTTERTYLRIEYTYYDVDFDNTFVNPTRLSFDIGFRF